MLSILFVSLLIATVECHPPHNHHRHRRALGQLPSPSSISPYYNTTTVQTTTTVPPETYSSSTAFVPEKTLTLIRIPSDNGHAPGSQSGESGYPQATSPSHDQGDDTVQIINEIDLSILVSYLQGTSSSNDQGTNDVQLADILNVTDLDLSGLDLENLDLSGVDLSDSDLSGLVSYLQAAISAIQVASIVGPTLLPDHNGQSGSSQGSPQPYGQQWQPKAQSWSSKAPSPPGLTPDPSTWTTWSVSTTHLTSSHSTTYTPSPISTSNHSSTLTSISSTSSAASPTPTPGSWANHTVTGYFGTGVSHTKIFPISKIPWQYLTHINYAFAKTQKDNTISYDPDVMDELSTAAQAHDVKVLLSIGGYGEGGQYFSDIVSTDQGIATFVSSIKAVVQKYGLAGVDLDWEFPGDLHVGTDRPETDAANYLKLLEALKSAMPDGELTAAVHMELFLVQNNSTNELEYVDMTPYIPYFTRLYLMAYDLWNLQDEGKVTAGSNGAFKPNPGNADQQYGYDGIMAWHQNGGFPMEKLSLGIPFYGFGYKFNNDSNPAKDGLYTSVAGHASGSTDEAPDGDSGYWGWRSLKSQNVIVEQSDGSYGAGPGWVSGYDNSSQTPYVYSTSKASVAQQQIISYDDPDSIRIKMDFARTNGMNGMMFWAMYGDTDDGELSGVLAEGRSTG
ncbi:hypothetical protein LTR10_016752 [Elasticomyces elasticus]|uniref:chitinase n=1 Tax=Exophiala sideris TaxID=1016849 RepID=A0ABR0JMP9_9EURO|nr:hypothetical protein LTR10_016752 [Elasticomyces elasticus]KAK5037756.1 hypothetical protein LTS07_001223 [Exophiala sideris]KAK5043738.1 hypothetical protein LTR13_000092 [Exophiala sideris]KAK5067237.1 hypothetical protein LTR69_001224 [Exophiala sideris]KAK5182570.1 hypothetical protein LTR44_004961 [Eurotiomycetes sp. CCFEE 6388]